MAIHILKKTIIFCVIAASLSLAGCNLLPGPNAIMVQATVTNIHSPTEIQVIVILTKNSVAFTGATVTVNGNSCTEGPDGTYSYNSATLIIENADVTLNIVKVADSVDITQTLKMPYEPTNVSITPAVGPNTFDATQPINLSWTAVAPTPSQIVILIESGYTQSATNYINRLSGSASSFQLPANTLSTGNTNVPLNIAATNTAILLGSSFLIGSEYTVANTNTQLINTQ